MNIFLYTINSKETNSSDTSNESSSSSVSNKSNSSTTNNKTYTKEEISNNGVVTGTSGVTYGWADNLSSSHKTINNESCLFLRMMIVIIDMLVFRHLIYTMKTELL